MGFLFARGGGGFIMEQFGVFINSAISLLAVEIRGETERLTDTLQMCLNPCLAAGTLKVSKTYFKLSKTYFQLSKTYFQL